MRLWPSSWALTEITAAGPNVRFASVVLPDSAQVRLGRIYPRSTYKAAAEVVLVPRPKSAEIGGPPMAGRELLDWTSLVIDTLAG